MCWSAWCRRSIGMSRRFDWHDVLGRSVWFGVLIGMRWQVNRHDSAVWSALCGGLVGMVCRVYRHDSKGWSARLGGLIDMLWWVDCAWWLWLNKVQLSTISLNCWISYTSLNTWCMKARIQLKRTAFLVILYILATNLIKLLTSLRVRYHYSFVEISL